MTSSTALPGGTFTLADGLTVTRVGYGAMQLAGPGVFGPPKDRDEAIAVLREAVDAGITHIDTADFYGPHITNELIREALHPYPEGLHLVTKIGSVRDEKGAWVPSRTPDSLRRQVHDNLMNLGLEQLEVVNVRVGGERKPVRGSVAEPFGAAAEMQREGLIKHLGVSTVSADQLAEAQGIAPVVCVQNFYNVANREDDPLVDSLASQGIAYVPYFPLGGFSPLQSDALNRVAERNGTSPLAVALAWLPQRSPNILLIAGTSSREHLRANIAAAGLQLSADDLLELEGIAG